MICMLDLDGVLIDFIGGVRKVFNLTKEEYESKTVPGDWHFYKGLNLTESDFWQEIDCHGRAFWENLEWTEDGKEILALVEKYFTNIVLVTAPSLSPDSSAGKVLWIRKNLPQYFRKFAITPDKSQFAHGLALLVDDSDSNVEKFYKAGGKCVLVPRRWNKLYENCDKVFQHLENNLITFCGKVE